MLNVQAYLERIHYAGPTAPTPETLRSVHRAHMFAVPFENLDIHLGRKIICDEDRFLYKIVDERRGGFCYELNGAFAALLRALGFQVSLLSARAGRDDGSDGPESITLRSALISRSRGLPTSVLEIPFSNRYALSQVWSRSSSGSVIGLFHPGKACAWNPMRVANGRASTCLHCNPGNSPNLPRCATITRPRPNLHLRASEFARGLLRRGALRCRTGN